MTTKTGILIGVVGFIGSGKDTVADMLIQQGFIKDSFAKTLKDAASVLFGWDRQMIEGSTIDSREWREHVDSYWAAETGDAEFTPRKALQLLGTEAIRETFAQDFWVSTMVKRWIEAGKPNTVITDCRFPNEIRAIRRNGGLVINVKRGAQPSWVPLVSRINNKLHDEADMIKFQSMLHNKELPHSSEYAWVGTKFDIVLDNNGTLADLNQAVKSINI